MIPVMTPGALTTEQEASRSDRVFLIGPMGSGKTTVGRKLALLLQRRFMDVDREIEARTGAGIPLIFDLEGEDGFRRRETCVLDELSREHDVVLATGGGAVLSGENRRLLRERGIVVYLRANADILLRRTRHDRNRPLLQTDDPRGRIVELLRARAPLYEACAHIIVDTDMRAPQRIARVIQEKLGQFNHAET